LARAVPAAARSYAAHQTKVHAAAIAYYAVLSFFPFVTLVAALAVLFVGESPADRRAFVESLHPFVPLPSDRFWALVERLVERGGVLSLASLLVLFLIASRVSLALDRALRDVFHRERRERGTLGQRLAAAARAHVLTLLGLVVIGALFVARNLFAFLRAADVRAADALARWLDHPLAWERVVPALAAGLACHALFRRAGPHVEPRWSAAGAGVFVLGLEGATSLFARYFAARLPAWDALHGSFVGLFALAVWCLWISTLLLFSAELAAQWSASASAFRAQRAAGAHA
jgi:YihY family inner membrane protein